MKLKIKTTNEAHPIVKAIKAEETAQTAQLIAEQAQRIKEHNRKQRRNEARREARQEAEAEAEATPRHREIEAPEQTPIITKYLIYAGSKATATPIKAETTQEAEETQKTKEIKALTHKSFICLYNSQRVIYNKKILNPETHKERLLINYLRPQNPLIYLNKATQTRTSQLRQISFNLSEANTPQARKFLLSFKGETEKATNTQQTETGKDKPIISYNNIGYEENEIIIIGEVKQLQTIIKTFKKKNKIQNGFYDFITIKPRIRTAEDREKAERLKEQRERTTEAIKETEFYKKAINERKAEILREDTRRREAETENTKTQTITTRGNRHQNHRERFIKNLLLNIDYWQEAEPEEKARLINNCLYYENRQTKTKTRVITKTRGLNNITENEKEALRKARNRPEYETQKEAKHLIEIATAEDGRLTQKNIEHSLRNNQEVKRLKTETSNILYYLIKEVEEATKEARKDRKKQTALLNVLKSFKQTAELKEELQESITEQIEEAENRQNQFKATKKNKNKYHTKTGITKENRKPSHQEYKYRNQNQEKRHQDPEKTAQELKTTEEQKKIKRNVLRSFLNMQELEKEAEARNEAKAEQDKEFQKVLKEIARETARRHNTRKLKEIRKIKEELKEERRREARKEPMKIFKRIEEENRKQAQKDTASYEIARRIRQQAHIRHTIEENTRNFYKSISWTPEATRGDKKEFIMNVIEFKQANEL